MLLVIKTRFLHFSVVEDLGFSTLGLVKESR
jgi:hypothetical protein